MLCGSVAHPPAGIVVVGTTQGGLCNKRHGMLRIYMFYSLDAVGGGLSMDFSEGGGRREGNMLGNA